MKNQIKGLRKLSTEEMEKVSGGQVDNCWEFRLVVSSLIRRGGNYELQARVIFDLYNDQYCG